MAVEVVAGHRIGEARTEGSDDVTFESKEKYLALADDRAQDTWYQEKLRPLLTEDPQCIDGNWAD